VNILSDLRIGVVGAGAIGTSHAKLLSNRISGAVVAAVNDVNEERAKQLALESGARYVRDPHELIHSGDVDAVLVTSWDATHEEYVVSALNSGKYVFCEKPLSPTSGGCRQIMEAEIAGGKRLLQVGFMRRFDEYYRQLKQVLADGMMGAPLMVHCHHRNQWPAGAVHTTDTLITRALSHEFDILRWLLEDDYVSAQMIRPAPSKYAEAGLLDPQQALLRTRRGICIDAEIAMHARYGYDIGCEIVCEEGSVFLPQPATPVLYWKGRKSREIYNGWKLRFMRAYETELNEWVSSVKKGAITGPSAWDGYVSSEVADICVKAGELDQRLPVDIGECPEFYAKDRKH